MDANKPRAWVRIVDDTGPRWPVYAATLEWDTPAKFDAIYNGDSCGGQGHCVRIAVTQNIDQPCLQYGGFAVLIKNVNNNHLSDATYVRFNSRCAQLQFSDRDRRALACEEIGHVIGLDHAASSLYQETCMASGPIDRLHHKPWGHDFNMIDNVIYDHND